MIPSFDWALQTPNISVSNPRNIISSAIEVIITELTRLHKYILPELVMFNDNRKCRMHNTSGFSDAPNPIQPNIIILDGVFILILVTPSLLKTYIDVIAPKRVSRAINLFDTISVEPWIANSTIKAMQNGNIHNINRAKQFFIVDKYFFINLYLHIKFAHLNK